MTLQESQGAYEYIKNTNQQGNMEKPFVVIKILMNQFTEEKFCWLGADTAIFKWKVGAEADNREPMRIHHVWDGTFDGKGQ